MCSFIAFAILICLTGRSSGWPVWRWGRWRGREWERERGSPDKLADDFQKLISHLWDLEDALYGLPDNATGARVAEWREGMLVNPEELGSYVEGDILFPRGIARNGLIARSTRWPGGVVPYTISPQFSQKQRKVIYDAMDDYHTNTCIRFRPYHGYEADYLRIIAGNSGCWSSVGRTGGRQDVNLQVPGCVEKKGTVIHELMHVVGFLHEQSRFERDKFVAIQWPNIRQGYDSNFYKAKKGATYAFGLDYDYNSVMHYSAYAFSRNGRPTIRIRSGSSGQNGQCNTAEDRLGQREGFSNADIAKIQRMYSCNNGLGFTLQNLLFGLH